MLPEPNQLNLPSSPSLPVTSWKATKMGIRPNSRPTGFQLLLELLLVLSFVNVGLVGAQDISSVASESSFVSSLSESVVPEPTFSGPPITESTLSSPPVTESTLSSPSPTEEPVTTSALEPTSTTVRIVTRTTIPIEPATFSPFPIPSETPIPGAFPASKPKSPPPPDSSEIPSFGAAWQEAYQKAKEKITTFTLAEKVNVTTGVGWMGGRCVGNIPPIPYTSNPNPKVTDKAPDGRDQWPGLCLEDSPLGVRFADYVTSFPAGINAAASWNRRLIRKRGLLMGREFKGKGVNVALGPAMNMARVAEGGRNWEGFGGDPFLAGEAAYETVLGLQEGGTQACAKHLLDNEQEYKRTMSSSEVDDRTEHEVYLPPFLKSVMAGATSIMCSYNLINGTYACENSRIMNEVVKEEFGFQGYILSDWQAHHSTMAAITGLDMSMPGDVYFNSNTSYWREVLVAFVENGTIPESRVDDMVTRILAGWYLLEQDSPSFPGVSFDAFRPDDETLNEHIDVQDDHYKLVRELGAASIVLLKNERDSLPLGSRSYNTGSFDDEAIRTQTLVAKEAERNIVLIGSGAGGGRAGPNQFPDHGGSDGHLASGWGSGTANFTYLVTPLDAIQRRAREDRTSVSWLLDDFDLPRAGNMARFQSAALVFISADSGEEYINVDGNQGDRKNLTAWHGGDDLVLAVAEQNNNTIVVVNSVGPIIMEPWIEHPNVTAVVWAGLLGTESGNAIADVLYGSWNPSGRLPYTIAKAPEDYSAQRSLGGGPGDIIAIPYDEGLEIDYRGFDARNITPRYEFGFGLSYTTFEYSGLAVRRIYGAVSSSDGDLVAAWERGEATPQLPGISRAFWLHQPTYEATFTVTNTGPVYGGDIPQLYIHFPDSAGEPPSVLKGFTDTEIGPGESKQVTITLSRYDLSIWDAEKQGWRKPEGTIGVSIARSSRNIKLRGTIPN
ncbi:extracellular beta-glucosidase [Coprinopsis cinerea okayama7|uniref:beta-glucosidase n=1 Tax=Coprinopsis cinerea (strain Okayama-7 / 130 / ATCC MYA-4618 / FGSC 9003) TaxID=240176 RepID=A8NIX3_COPC7|nr:extracellular beta-glucosidase [Coprinopsis cinerea okayama7\|eukprot:XP_001834093.2 extracellular beta-glucosidase [Coprinopsis cinerea okayama7\